MNYYRHIEQLISREENSNTDIKLMYEPYVKQNYAKRAGIINKLEEYTNEIDENFDFRIAGVNHFTWVIKAEYEGKDLTIGIAEALKKEAATETNGYDTGAKAEFNEYLWRYKMANGVISQNQGVKSMCISSIVRGPYYSDNTE